MNTLGDIVVRAGNVIAFPSHNKVLSLKEKVIDALNADRFSLDYQPQYDLNSGTMTGAEALLRLRDRAGEVMNAATVVETAERESLIDWLGSAVMSKACQEFARMRVEGLQLDRLAINVSPFELRQNDYAEQVVSAIEGAGLSFSDVELEITESASLADPTLILDHLHTLADLGIRLAVDDFGSGHSAWTHVVNLPITTLKIDRALASQVTTSKKAAVVIENICKTCSDLDMQVIGEGVNSPEQQSTLSGLGCTIGQGFGLSRPVAAAALMALPSQVVNA